jgi:hypothetical protein
MDGEQVGVGAAGIRAMIGAFQHDRHPGFVLTPRIKNEGSASPWIAQDQLAAWVEEAGLKPQTWPGEIVDFARMMDDE